MPGFFSPESKDLNWGDSESLNGRQKISLRKGVFIPLHQGLSAVQCGFARHARPLKATTNHPSVDIVWTL